MKKPEYYVDTCIWLNLFKKEGDPTKGVPYWQLAKEFVEQAEEKNETILVSTIILKELQCKAGEKFDELKQFFKETTCIQLIKTTNEDYTLARIFEQQHGQLSFYDYLHVAIAKRLKALFITRDSELLQFARNNVLVFKPEELLR